jgi:hypothetical protein
MTAIQISGHHFFGSSKVFGNEPDALTNLIRSILQYQAKTALYSTTALTDSTGGPTSNGIMRAIPALVPVAVASAGTKASGTITFTGTGTAADTVTVNGVAITLETSGATGNQINIGASAALTAQALYNFLVASTNASLLALTYAIAGAVITVTAVASGTPGNALTLAKSSTAVTVSGATLTGGTDVGAQKASFEAALVTVGNGVTALIKQINVLVAKVPAFAALTDSTGFTSSGTTVAAITQSISAVSTSFASYAGAVTAIAALASAVSAVAYWTNRLAVVAGLTPLVNSSGVTPPVATYSDGVFTANTDYSTGVIPAVSTSTGTAVSGADALANAGFTVTNADAVLVALADGVREQVTLLNTITSGTAPLLPAVAGYFPA